MGKELVEANDLPGFISNRILCPMINEAIFALQENVGTPEAIDAVDEARDELSDGAAHTGRLDRTRCGLIHNGSPAEGFGRRQISSRAAVAENGGRRLFGKEDRERILYVK